MQTSSSAGVKWKKKQEFRKAQAQPGWAGGCDGKGTTYKAADDRAHVL